MSAQDINSIKTFSNHALRPYHAFQEPFAGAWGPRGWCWGLLLVTPWGLLALSLRLWELWRAGKWSSWDGKAHTWVISPAKPGRRLWAGRGLQCPWLSPGPGEKRTGTANSYKLLLQHKGRYLQPQNQLTFPLHALLFSPTSPGRLLKKYCATFTHSKKEAPVAWKTSIVKL